MKKTSFKVSTTTLSTTRTFENVKTAEKKSLVNPPSEETVARLNAIAREYPFCAYIKQKNSFIL